MEEVGQKSQAIKLATADYNVRECVVSGDHPKRAKVAIFQKLTRMPELRPLRDLPENSTKRKSYGATKNDDRHEPIAKRNKADSEGANDDSDGISAESKNESKKIGKKQLESRDTVMEQATTEPAAVGVDNTGDHVVTQTDI
jgi:hypothetical protein